jgi:hypothetical protein
VTPRQWSGIDAATIDQPIVYSTRGQMATLLASIGQLVEREPDETFTDPDARAAARGLTALIERRLIETD